MTNNPSSNCAFKLHTLSRLKNTFALFTFAVLAICFEAKLLALFHMIIDVNVYKCTLRKDFYNQSRMITFAVVAIGFEAVIADASE